MKSAHYELKQIYYGLLQADPDYPAWQDFEWKNRLGEWVRLRTIPCWDSIGEYRFNPLSKKWVPKYGWVTASINVSPETDHRDLEKLQAYATKLSWLREQGGYEFKTGEHNWYIFTLRHNDNILLESNHYDEQQDAIYMNREQAEKWLEMVKNGEV